VRVNQDQTNADQFQQYLRVDAQRPARTSVLRPPPRPAAAARHTRQLVHRHVAGAARTTAAPPGRETRSPHDSWDPTINPPLSPSGEFIGDYQGLVADDCYAVPFVNDTHLANDPGRDADFDAGLPRSQFQQVFCLARAQHGGLRRPRRPVPLGRRPDRRDGRAGAATRRASRAATRVLRVTPRRVLRAVARRNAIVGPK
jgi:hypothetical protein